jgi:hypothetical protein
MTSTIHRCRQDIRCAYMFFTANVRRSAYLIERAWDERCRLHPLVARQRMRVG